MESSKNPPTTGHAVAGPSKPKAAFPRPATLAKSHEAHSSLRVQTAKQKQKQKQQKQGEAGGAGAGGEAGKGVQGGQVNGQGKGKGKQKDVGGGSGDREITKVVLASPLTPRWPKITPEHQSLILQCLLSSFPGLAEYHLSRERLSKLRRKERKTAERAAGGPLEKGKKKGKKGEPIVIDDGEEGLVVEEQPEVAGTAGAQKRVHPIMEEDAEDSTRPAKRPRLDPPTGEAPSTTDQSTNEPAVTPAAPAEPPVDIVSNMLIGINEVMKGMEKQTSRLRIDIWEKLCGDAQLAKGPGNAAGLPSNLIPAAAPVVDDDSSSDSDVDMEPAPQPTSTPSTGLAKYRVLGTTPGKPLKVIFVCLPDINPRELADAMPMYAMSWNAIVRQHRGAVEKVRAEAKAKGKGVDGEEGEKPEEVFLVTLPVGAELLLARAMGLRRVAVFGLTTAFPGLDTLLSLFTSASLKPPLPPFPLHVPAHSTSLPLNPPFAHTHLKAILTTCPADPKARKKDRVDAMKAKREEKKEKKVLERERKRREGVMMGGRLVGGTDSTGKGKGQNGKRDGKGGNQDAGGKRDVGKQGQGFMQKQKQKKAEQKKQVTVVSAEDAEMESMAEGV